MKYIFLGGIIIIAVAVSGALFIKKKELATPKTESSIVRYHIKDLPKHGISLLSPSDPALSKNLKTIDPYSVFLNNKANRAIVGYSIKWECFDGKTESASRNASYDRYLRSALGVVFMYGEEIERKAILNSLEEVIRPNLTWLISYDFPAHPIDRAVEEPGSGFTKTALAEIRTACPTITVTVDGIFFDDGTFVGPDTIGFFSHVETQMAVRHEVLQKVQSELKLGKTPMEVFQGLEQIVNSEIDAPRGETQISRSDFRKLFAQDVLGLKNVWGIEKAIEKVQEQLNRPWVKLRKIED